MSGFKKTTVWILAFAIAMGFLESAVVIYLREVYYKDGFSFPLRPMSSRLVAVELWREAATLIMLAGIGVLAGKTRPQRFAYFCLAFAVWDLFYYVFLYVCLQWPASPATWDLLFLIPLPWIGPVWAPCAIALLMMGQSIAVIIATERSPAFRLSRQQWLPWISGALLCMIAFMWDYLRMIFSGPADASALEAYVPASFNTALFLAGFLLMVLPSFMNNKSFIKIKFKTNR